MLGRFVEGVDQPAGLHEEASNLLGREPLRGCVRVPELDFGGSPGSGTSAIQENERRLDEWMEAKAGELLRAMGATRVWRGLRLGGVCSSHDLGGCRMGADPAASVVEQLAERLR